MGAKFWFMAAAAGLGGYLAWRRLLQTASGESAEYRPVQPLGAAARKARPMTPLTVEEAQEKILLDLVRARPGLLQTEIYPELANLDRKFLQELLLRLARSGRIRRERERSSYRVFPA